jgi:hypothetical protein
MRDRFDSLVPFDNASAAIDPAFQRLRRTAAVRTSGRLDSVPRSNKRAGHLKHQATGRVVVSIDC